MASTLSTLQTGGTVVAPPRFNPLNFWPVVKEHNVTWFSATADDRTRRCWTTRAQHEAGGARDAALHPELQRGAAAPVVMDELEQQFGVPVLEAYGMTEAAHQMASNPLPPGNRLPVRRSDRGRASRSPIMDEEGTLLITGERGEVVIRGENVITGYENNPEANATSFTNGWFRTGDEGMLDGDGYLTLTGRLKEMINRSGEKISPLEIDNALLDHPAVGLGRGLRECRTRRTARRLRPVVLTGEVTPQELVAFCRTKLADYKCPRVIHVMRGDPARARRARSRRRFLTEMFSKGA